MSGILEALAELQEGLARAFDRVARLEAAAERHFRKGKVTDVDPAKREYRQEVGVDENGQPVKGPWIPYSQQAGAFKGHIPPSVGQQMMMIAPDGDFTQAFGIPLTWSDSNPSPASSADPVATYGQHKMTTAPDSHTHAIGANVEAKMSAGGARFKVPALNKFVIEAGGQFYSIKASALDPASDI